MTLKRLSPNTVAIYKAFFKKFLADHTGKDIDKLGYHELYNYLKERSAGLGDTQRPRKGFYLPDYFTRQEISAMP